MAIILFLCSRTVICLWILPWGIERINRLFHWCILFTDTPIAQTCLLSPSLSVCQLPLASTLTFLIIFVIAMNVTLGFYILHNATWPLLLWDTVIPIYISKSLSIIAIHPELERRLSTGQFSNKCGPSHQSIPYSLSNGKPIKASTGKYHFLVLSCAHSMSIPAYLFPKVFNLSFHDVSW
jgi:hypothetical protein